MKSGDTMTPEAWVALATVFCLGAMSPGPSLAVVLRNTLAGGRTQGVMTGVGHGTVSYTHLTLPTNVAV